MVIKFDQPLLDDGDVRRASEIAKQIATAADEAARHARSEERETMRRALEKLDQAEERIAKIETARTLAECRDNAEMARAHVNVAGAILAGARVSQPFLGAALATAGKWIGDDLRMRLIDPKETKR